jgi:3D (Asp-Asp-Asp) domain-containing protein
MKKSIAAALVGLSVLMAAGTAQASAKTHVTGDNDTFWKLSKQYHVSLDALLKANPKINPLNVYKGLKLTIPAKANNANTLKANSKQVKPVLSAKTVTAKSGSTYTYLKALDVKATAYTAAALGTKLYVTGYDYNGLPIGGMIATATDIGGAIKGNRIDIFVPGSTNEARSFGIQNVKVFILK